MFVGVVELIIVSRLVFVLMVSVVMVLLLVLVM